MRALTDVVEELILDLLEWLSASERTYEETMDAWRTSCPRLTVWEDSCDSGLVEVVRDRGGVIVRLTPAGFDKVCQRHVLANQK